MGNLLQYTNKAKTIDAKLNLMIDAINTEYKNGTISSETEYYYRIKQLLQVFYQTIHKPMFVFVEAKDSPISEQYNTMMTNAINDIQFILEDSENLSSSITSSFGEANKFREMMGHEIKYLTNQIDLIQKNIEARDTKHSICFSEFFDKKSNNAFKDATTSCSVNYTYNFLTLPVRAASTVELEEIVLPATGSNGFPGNSHLADIKDGALHFVGEDDLKNDLSALLNQNEDEWFEYELIEIDKNKVNSVNGYGFEYDEGVSWLKKAEPLRLRLVLYPKQNKKANMLCLSPYLSDAKGAVAATLSSCFITNVNSVTTKMQASEVFDRNKVLFMDPQQIAKIELNFVQTSGYDCEVGHVYYHPVNTRSLSIFSEGANSTLARINGNNPSIDGLGITYDPFTGWVSDQSTKGESLTKQKAKNALFSYAADSIDSKSGQELLSGKRYVVGVSSVQLASNTYYDTGHYVSNAYTTEEPITSIMLDANEYLPEEYDHTCISYAISIDDGNTWHTISPIRKPYEEGTVYKYNINNDSIDNLLSTNKRETKIKNINTLSDVYSVKVKITMTTKKEVDVFSSFVIDPYKTPVVYDYKLTVTTGGDTIEY